MKKNLIFLGVLILSIVLFFYFKVDSDVINVSEKRFIVYSILICLFALTFATLRLYNAVVTNSSYILKLKKQMELFIAELRTISRDITNNSNRSTTAINTASNRLEQLKTTIGKLIDLFVIKK